MYLNISIQMRINSIIRLHPLDELIVINMVILETKNRRKCYEALKDKDEKDQQVIAQQLLRITNLFEEIRKFRGNITTYDAMVKKEISEIMMEHDFFQKASWTMKNRLSSGVYIII